MSASHATTDLRDATGGRGDLIVALVALAVVALDQLTKALIVAHFSGPRTDEVVPALGQIVVLQYLRNTGAAFSSFTGSPVLLTVVIIAAIGVIAWLYWSSRGRANAWLKVTFGLIAGGAVGNLIDRFRHGYVVDFIHFQIPGHFSFAVFNVADSAITVGVIALALLSFFGPTDAEAAQTVAPVAAAPAKPASAAPTARTQPAATPARPSANVAAPRTTATPRTNAATKAAARKRKSR